MKALGLALIAVLAIGCSSSPTSPSTTSPPGPVVIDQAARPDHTPGTYKVAIYFYGPQFGRNVLYDMPVHVWSTSVSEQLLTTNKRHEVELDVPKTDTWVGYRVDTDHWPGVCLTEGVIPLPYSVGENWVRVDKCVAE